MTDHSQGQHSRLFARITLLASAVTLLGASLAWNVSLASSFQGGAPPSSDAERVAPSRADKIREFLLDESQNGMIVVSHRGHHGAAPENTLAAIEAAAEVGAHIVEIDVRKTSDGGYVLMHDTTVDRTTVSKGRVADLTLEQVTRLQILDGQRPTAHRPPTLEQALETARGRVMLNIDLKTGSLVEVVEIARSSGTVSLCLFKARWDRIEKGEHEWIARQPDVLFMPIARSFEESEEAIAALGPPAVEIIQPLDRTLGEEEAEIFERWSDAGVRTWANTLWNGRLAWGLSDYEAVEDPDAIFGTLIDHGVSIVQTDLPEVAVDVLRRRGDLPDF
ncbi:MAG: glycerophosphodiester phosphodiesterase family protein [Planctomycetota bacterium]